MRELKFRAWFKGDPEPVTYSSDDLFDDTWTDHEVTVVEQYTGYEDINGKKIYDGDIIEEEIDSGIDDIDGTFRYKVYWNENQLCWSLEPIGSESIHTDLWEVNQSMRVIGNIHENPELLKG